MVVGAIEVEEAIEEVMVINRATEATDLIDRLDLESMFIILTGMAKMILNQSSRPVLSIPYSSSILYFG